MFSANRLRLLLLSAIQVAALCLASSAFADLVRSPYSAFWKERVVAVHPRPIQPPSVGLTDEELRRLSKVNAYTLRHVSSGEPNNDPILPLGEATRAALSELEEANEDGRAPSPEFRGAMNEAVEAAKTRQKDLHAEVATQEKNARDRRTPPNGVVVRQRSEERADAHIRAVRALGQELEHAPLERWSKILNRAADNLDGAANALHEVFQNAPFADYGVLAKQLAGEMEKKAGEYRTLAAESRKQADEYRAQAPERRVARALERAGRRRMASALARVNEAVRRWVELHGHSRGVPVLVLVTAAHASAAPDGRFTDGL
jgi:hypothetical protein